MTSSRAIRPTTANGRRGTITPLVLMSLIAVMAGVALVLDRLWLDSAMVELTTAAESAALAAGRSLISDDLLRSDDGTPQAAALRDQRRIEAARQAAADLASRNLIAGKPVDLDTRPDGDVRFGRSVVDEQTGATRFLETQHSPATVVVTAHRTRRRSNPVALAFEGLAGRFGGDVVAQVAATIDNRVIGVRPLDDVPAPALPLAILKHDPSGARTDTWQAQVEQRLGQDQFQFHGRTGRVLSESDGIPEIVLRTANSEGADDAANVQLIDLGSDLQTAALTRQIREGWSADDLEEHNGELHSPSSSSSPILLVGRSRFDGATLTALAETLGQPRICLLYESAAPIGQTGLSQIRCCVLVAGRVMSVRALPGGAGEIIFQPAVVTTRTALLAETNGTGANKSEQANPYIYKLQLTN